MLVAQNRAVPATVEGLMGPETLARLERLDLASRKVFAGKLPGERRSKRRGQSVEFDDYRDYTPGDDLRRLDWNVFARLDRFLIKLYRAEEDLGLHILIDASASMLAGGDEHPTKLLFAHRLALALAFIGLVRQNRVRVAAFGAAEPVTLRPLRGRHEVRRVAEFLLDSLRTAERQRLGASGEGGEALERACRVFGASRVGGGLVVFITDALIADTDALRRGLRWLAAPGGVDVTLIRTLTRAELDPARSAGSGLVGDLRLVDAETLRGTEVTVSPALLAAYRARAEAHAEAVARACASLDISHELVTTDADPADLILGPLRRRGLVR